MTNHWLTTTIVSPPEGRVVCIGGRFLTLITTPCIVPVLPSTAWSQPQTSRLLALTLAPARLVPRLPPIQATSSTLSTLPLLVDYGRGLSMPIALLGDGLIMLFQFFILF